MAEIAAIKGVLVIALHFSVDRNLGVVVTYQRYSCLPESNLRCFWMVGIMQVKRLSIVALIVLECVLLGITISSDTLLVETKYGKILGRTRHFPEQLNGDIRYVNTFLGIPFASPPVNHLRFRPPEPPAAWKPHIYNATFFRNVCQQPQNSYFEDSIRIVWPGFTWEKDSSEDCLYLNIFAPGNNVTNTSELYPVIMFIHGGSYVYGTTARHTTPGEVLPRWGVVLVTIQYRLGPFGFLTTGDSAAPGNWGLLDQVQAFKWIQENIKAFGGDPNKVTILGVSSGGASVGLHLLSPRSKGLFHQAIAESGVEFSPFAFQSVKEAALKTKITAMKLGCSSENSHDMIKCLRKKEARSIVLKYDWKSTGPVIDNYFIYDTPENLRRSGQFYHVPLIGGFNSDEGAHNTPEVYHPPTEITSSVFRDSIKSFVKDQMVHENEKTAVLVEDAIEFQYTPWSKASDSLNLRKKIINIQSDYYVAAPTVEVLGIHSTSAPTYMYEFSHRSKADTEDAWMGVKHGDNTPYDFGAPFVNISSLTFTEEDQNVSSLIMSLYANFAKYGNPTPQAVQGMTWGEFNRTTRLYLRIQGRPDIQANFEPQRMAFWNSYYPRLLNFSNHIGQEAISGTNHNEGVERVSNPGLISLVLASILFFLAPGPV